MVRLAHHWPHLLQNVQGFEVFGEHDGPSGAIIKAMDRMDRRILLDLMHQTGLALPMGGDARLFEHHKVVVVGVQKGHLRALEARTNPTKLWL